MRILAITFFCSLLLSLGVYAQAQKTAAVKSPASAENASSTPAASAGYLYKGIGIGSPADDVRKKLGEPKEKTDPQDLFVFSDEESVQFLYGPDKKVTAMITFSGKMTGAPTAKAVFGEDVAARPDGGLFKMVRYPKAGYWISYNKIVGDDSIISIAMQKL